MPLQIPVNLHRNSSYILDPAHGLEQSGEYLINLVMRRIGKNSLEDSDILDIGCGSRLVATIVNRNISIKSYSGVEIHKPTIDYLNEHVAKRDPRFRFAHWDVQNDLYNPRGTPLLNTDTLPFDQQFNLIWLFSVFTHLNPADTSALLAILRRYVTNDGKLFFSAFVDHRIDGFEDRETEKPLLKAYYGSRFIQSLIREHGWTIDGFFDKDPKTYIQSYFICSPA